MIAAALRSRILDQYGVHVAHEADAQQFGKDVTQIRLWMESLKEDVFGLPLYGAHVNTDLSYIGPKEFMASIGLKNSYAIATNTARLYRFDTPKTLRWLFESCRLWYDEPELHAPLMRCDVISDDPRMDKPVDAVVHVGTAWVHPSLRGNGLGKMMVALHRLEAMERLGEHLMFGTTVASKTGGFTGKTDHHGTATVCMFAPGDPNGAPEIQHIRLWTKADTLSAASRIAESGINATT